MSLLLRGSVEDAPDERYVRAELPEYLANDLALYWKADGPHVTAQGAKLIGQQL